MGHARVAVTDYCERVGDSFWAEPLNATTNLAFLLVAVLVAMALLRRGVTLRRSWDLWLLIGLMVAIGIGSFLWHTLATPWTEAADVIPIVLFISLCIPSYLVRVTALEPVWIFFWWVFFHSLNYFVQSSLPADLFNGSIFYLPAWMTLLAITVYSRFVAKDFDKRLFYAFLLFSLSLIFRTLDRSLCSAWPLGTHFAWHLLNGVTLYLVMKFLLPRRHGLEKGHGRA